MQVDVDQSQVLSLSLPLKEACTISDINTCISSARVNRIVIRNYCPPLSLKSRSSSTTNISPCDSTMFHAIASSWPWQSTCRQQTKIEAHVGHESSMAC